MNNHHHGHPSNINSYVDDESTEDHQQYQHQEHDRPSYPIAVDASQVVATILMTIEELRLEQSQFLLHGDDGRGSPPSLHHVMHWRDVFETLILQHLEILSNEAHRSATATASNQISSTSLSTIVAQPWVDLWSNCRTKVLALLQDQTIPLSFQVEEPTEDDSVLLQVPLDVLQQDCQGAIARLVELCLVLLSSSALPSSPLESHQQRGGESTREEVKSNDETTVTTITSTTATAGDGDLPSTMKDMVESYVQYQRRLVRRRVKPAIAELVQLRKLHQEQHQHQHQHHQQQHANGLSGGGGDEVIATLVGPQHQQHASTMAFVLGQAAVLIFPLLEWQANLPPLPMENENGAEPMPSSKTSASSQVIRALHALCRDTTSIVHEQAQTLVPTIASWLFEDWKFEQWMQLSNQSTTTLSRDELGYLDGLVEELARACHATSRYLTVTQDIRTQSPSSRGLVSSLHDLLQEWMWKYATLERFLVLQNWQSALSYAQPTVIVLGTMICVPSLVEDAQYLSMRALTRASTTQSALAVGTVAHATSHDVWSTEHEPNNDTVHQALLQRIGCWNDDNHNHHHDETAPTKSHGHHSGAALSTTEGTAPRSGDFASALLSALDDEDGGPHSVSSAPSRTPRKKKPPSAPTSGSFLSLLLDNGDDEQAFQRQLDAEFCALNGIHAAGAACRGLVSFLDSLLSSSNDDDDDDAAVLPQHDDKAMAMIQLAREDLDRYCREYDQFLQVQIRAHIEKYSQVFVLLQLFFQLENYQLSSTTIVMAESDDRLDNEMMEPLKQSRFLNQLCNKLEGEVRQKMVDEIVLTIVQLILNVLWNEPTKDNLDNTNTSASNGTVGKSFTDLGALLLSKQVRMLQMFVSSIASDPNNTNNSTGLPQSSSSSLIPNLSLWERLLQVLTALQLERPSDWLSFHYHSSSSLTIDELKSTLRLRVDFSPDAIHAVVNQVANQIKQQR